MHAIKSRLPALLRGLLKISQRFGANITPNHFYSDIPDLRHLEKSDYWRRPLSTSFIRGADVDGQVAFLESVCGPVRDRLESDNIYQQACERNGEVGFGPTECDVLYAYIRTQKPPKIFQVGCGVSTAIILIAAEHEREAGNDYKPEIVCAEPYPTEMLKSLASQGLIRLEAAFAQCLDPSVLTDLPRGGLLFIDSSHSIRPGSEVIWLMSEVLPRLPEGACVHFHDIFMPYEYAPEILHNHIFFFRESPFLQIYLTENPNYSVQMSLAMLHNLRPEALRRAAPRFEPAVLEKGLMQSPGHIPSSIYLKRG